MSEVIKITSTVLSEAEYNIDTNNMKITFVSGKSYIYYNVPATVWDAFKKAESKGSFFSRFIKGKYLAPVENKEIPKDAKTITVKPVDNQSPPTLQDFLRNKKREA